MSDEPVESPSWTELPMAVLQELFSEALKAPAPHMPHWLINKAKIHCTLQRVCKTWGSAVKEARFSICMPTKVDKNMKNWLKKVRLQSIEFHDPHNTHPETTQLLSDPELIQHSGPVLMNLIDAPSDGTWSLSNFPNLDAVRLVRTSASTPDIFDASVVSGLTKLEHLDLGGGFRTAKNLDALPLKLRTFSWTIPCVNALAGQLEFPSWVPTTRRQPLDLLALRAPAMMVDPLLLVGIAKDIELNTGSMLAYNSGRGRQVVQAIPELSAALEKLALSQQDQGTGSSWSSSWGQGPCREAAHCAELQRGLDYLKQLARAYVNNPHLQLLQICCGQLFMAHIVDDLSELDPGVPEHAYAKTPEGEPLMEHHVSTESLAHAFQAALAELQSQQSARRGAAATSVTSRYGQDTTEDASLPQLFVGASHMGELELQLSRPQTDPSRPLSLRLDGKSGEEVVQAIKEVASSSRATECVVFPAYVAPPRSRQQQQQQQASSEAQAAEPASVDGHQTSGTEAARQGQEGAGDAGEDRAAGEASTSAVAGQSAGMDLLQQHMAHQKLLLSSHTFVKASAHYLHRLNNMVISPTTFPKNLLQPFVHLMRVTATLTEPLMADMAGVLPPCVCELEFTAATDNMTFYSTILSNLTDLKHLSMRWADADMSCVVVVVFRNFHAFDLSVLPAVRPGFVLSIWDVAPSRRLPVGSPDLDSLPPPGAVKDMVLRVGRGGPGSMEPPSQDQASSSARAQAQAHDQLPVRIYLKSWTPMCSNIMAWGPGGVELHGVPMGRRGAAAAPLAELLRELAASPLNQLSVSATPLTLVLTDGTEMDGVLQLQLMHITQASLGPWHVEFEIMPHNPDEGNVAPNQSPVVSCLTFSRCPSYPNCPGHGVFEHHG